jgi:hypothetical protein
VAAAEVKMPRWLGGCRGQDASLAGWLPRSRYLARWGGCLGEMPRLWGDCQGQDAASLGNIKAYLYSSIIINYTLFETTKSHILIWIKIKWKFFFLVT